MREESSRIITSEEQKNIKKVLETGHSDDIRFGTMVILQLDLHNAHVYIARTVKWFYSPKMSLRLKRGTLLPNLSLTYLCKQTCPAIIYAK